MQRLLLTAAAANGWHCGPGERIDAGNIRTILRHAFPPIQAAGFSTLSVPDILSNLANKELLAAFQEEDQTWREISRVASVNDFKQHSAHRMLDDMEYAELGPTGEIKHGELGEEKFTRQVRTYAKMFVLTREDIINDDLGAFDDLRNRIGRGAGRKFNSVFWSTFMNNSAFFTTQRANYKTGTGTALGVDGTGLQALKDAGDTNTIVTKTYNNVTVPTNNGVNDLGALDATHKVLAANEIVHLTVTCGTTADPPAMLLRLVFRPTNA